MTETTLIFFAKLTARPRRWSTALLILWLTLASWPASGWSMSPGAPTLEAAATESLEETWGVQPEALRLSAGGYMLDFRFRVIDPDKAAPLFQRKIKPYLLDQASGAKFIVPTPPTVGPLRTTYKPQANRIYVMLFANPGRFVKPGRLVTVVMGDFRAENLQVQ